MQEAVLLYTDRRFPSLSSMSRLTGASWTTRAQVSLVDKVPQ